MTWVCGPCCKSSEAGETVTDIVKAKPASRSERPEIRGREQLLALQEPESLEDFPSTVPELTRLLKDIDAHTSDLMSAVDDGHHAHSVQSVYADTVCGNSITSSRSSQVATGTGPVQISAPSGPGRTSPSPGRNERRGRPSRGSQPSQQGTFSQTKGPPRSPREVLQSRVVHTTPRVSVIEDTPDTTPKARVEKPSFPVESLRPLPQIVVVPGANLDVTSSHACSRSSNKKVGFFGELNRELHRQEVQARAESVVQALFEMDSEHAYGPEAEDDKESGGAARGYFDGKAK